MYRQGTGQFEVETAEQVRMVPMRRLGSLLAEGVIPEADFVKIDVKGFEKDVLLGARELLRTGMLGLHTETNFAVSPLSEEPFWDTGRTGPGKPPCGIRRCIQSNTARELSARTDPERARAYFRAGCPRQTGHSRCYIRPGSHRRDRPPEQLSEAVPPLQRQSTDQVHDHLRTGRLNDVALDTAERFAERLGAQLPDAWWPYSDRDDMLRSATAEERDAASRISGFVSPESQ